MKRTEAIKVLCLFKLYKLRIITAKIEDSRTKSQEIIISRARYSCFLLLGPQSLRLATRHHKYRIFQAAVDYIQFFDRTPIGALFGPEGQR
jgi:hypothetical protein